MKVNSFWIIFCTTRPFWVKSSKRVGLGSIFSQLDKFRIEKFRTCQISEKKLTPHQNLKWNWCVQKQILSKVLLSENHFLDLFSPWKRQTLQLCIFSKTTNWWKEWKKNQFPVKTFEKNQISEKVFKNASDFESRKSEDVRILVKSTQLVIFWIGIPKECQILKHPFYHTSDFDHNI